MLRNYFKIAFRNLAENKVFSFINIVGLSVSLTFCIYVLTAFLVVGIALLTVSFQSIGGR